MATKLANKTTFEVDQVIRPIYTGGSVALDSGSRILATTLGEDAVLTDFATGKLLARIEGVRASEADAPCREFGSGVLLYTFANRPPGWRTDLDFDMCVIFAFFLAPHIHCFLTIAQ